MGVFRQTRRGSLAWFLAMAVLLQGTAGIEGVLSAPPDESSLAALQSVDSAKSSQLDSGQTPKWLGFLRYLPFQVVPPTTDSQTSEQRNAPKPPQSRTSRQTAAKTQTRGGLPVLNSPSGPYRVTDDDVELLARAVYSEARGEPYVGQVAVAAVILNRVESSSFPDSVDGVIFQPYAFTAVYDGQFNMQPDSMAYRAAHDALKGGDPTGGAIYYYNPSTATSGWIWTRQIVTQLGEHVFAK